VLKHNVRYVTYVQSETVDTHTQYLSARLYSHANGRTRAAHKNLQIYFHICNQTVEMRFSKSKKRVPSKCPAVASMQPCQVGQTVFKRIVISIFRYLTTLYPVMLESNAFILSFVNLYPSNHRAQLCSTSTNEL
jgi:hypothetical protein